MPLYIALVSYTDRGIQTVRDSPRRLDQAKALLVEMGGRFHAVYMTMGEHDLVLVYEASDDAVAARFTLRGRLRSRRRLGERGHRRARSAVQGGATLTGDTPCGRPRAGPSSATSAPGRP